MRRVLWALLLILAEGPVRAQPAGACHPGPDLVARLTADLAGLITTVDRSPPPAVVAFFEGVGGGEPEWLGDGWTVRVWGNEEWVVKASFLDVFQDRDGGSRRHDPAKRQVIQDHSVWLIEKLRSSSRFVAWRDKVPELCPLGPYLVAQRRAKGFRLSELSGAAAAHATAQRDAIWAAAAEALPGETELDVNDGNVLFDGDGNLVSWFDPAGGSWWISHWQEGDPAVRTFWDRASTLIHRRIDGTAFRPTTGKFPIGGSYGKTVEGGDLAFGDGLVVANLDVAVNRAFLIRHGFRTAYESTGYPETAGQSLGSLLGAPLDEERWEGDQVVQHFEHGWLSWNQGEGVRVHLE